MFVILINTFVDKGQLRVCVLAPNECTERDDQHDARFVATSGFLTNKYSFFFDKCLKSRTCCDAQKEKKKKNMMRKNDRLMDEKNIIASRLYADALRFVDLIDCALVQDNCLHPLALLLRQAYSLRGGAHVKMCRAPVAKAVNTTAFATRVAVAERTRGRNRF